MNQNSMPILTHKALNKAEPFKVACGIDPKNVFSTSKKWKDVNCLACLRKKDE